MAEGAAQKACRYTAKCDYQILRDFFHLPYSSMRAEGS